MTLASKAHIRLCVQMFARAGSNMTPRKLPSTQTATKIASAWNNRFIAAAVGSEERVEKSAETRAKERKRLEKHRAPSVPQPLKGKICSIQIDYAGNLDCVRL